jgi:hypothetical protein
MARDAISGRVLIAVAGVTAAAARRLVSAGERVVGLVVVEARGRPRHLVVTLPAVFGQRSVMSVVVLVATDAVEGRIPPRDIGNMTGPTARTLVRSSQRVIRLRVVEGGFGESPDVGVASAMISVTGATLPGRGEGMSRVEAFPGREVRGDLVVAVEAERTLCVRLERLMA